MLSVTNGKTFQGLDIFFKIKSRVNSSFSYVATVHRLYELIALSKKMYQVFYFSIGFRRYF